MRCSLEATQRDFSMAWPPRKHKRCWHERATTGGERTMTEDHTMSSCSLRQAVNAAREPLEAGMASEAAMLETELFCTHSVMARMTARMAPKRLTLFAQMTWESPKTTMPGVRSSVCVEHCVE